MLIWKGLSGLFSSFFESFCTFWQWSCQNGISFFGKIAHWSKKSQYPAVWYHLLRPINLFTDAVLLSGDLLQMNISRYFFRYSNFIAVLKYMAESLFLHGWTYHRLSLDGSRCEKKKLIEIEIEMCINGKLLDINICTKEMEDILWGSYWKKRRRNLKVICEHI